MSATADVAAGSGTAANAATVAVDRTATHYHVFVETAKKGTWAVVEDDVVASSVKQAIRAVVEKLDDDKKPGRYVAVAHSGFQPQTVKLETPAPKLVVGE